LTLETLAQKLQTSAVDFDTLHENYHPMLELVRTLIGVVPNCDPLLEIWPIGFRTYNLLVPNCLNLPFSLFGFGASKVHVGLAMYAASRAAACAYCSAHTCAFALRRGANVSALTGKQDVSEAVVVAVAEGLSRIPADLTAAQCQDLAEHFSPADIEWIVLSIGMMGFLNKLMDALGVELEAQSLAEVGALLTQTGWTAGQHAPSEVQLPTTSALPRTDSIGTYLHVLRQLPAAIRLEQNWTANIPNHWPEAGIFLKQVTGHDFPLLGHLHHARSIRALTTVLRDNLDPNQSEIGLLAKCLAGLVYATVVGNQTLINEAQILAKHLAPEIAATTLTKISQFATTSAIEEVTACQQALSELAGLPGLSRKDAAAVMLARSAATSPAQIGAIIVAEVTSLLNSIEIVELIVWLSLQQLLHRVGYFYTIYEQIKA
jgi:hypothetical protein